MTNDGMPEEIDYGQVPPEPDEVLPDETPNAEDELSPEQHKMLKELDQFVVTPHPQAEEGDIVPPVDPTPPDGLEKLVELLKLTEMVQGMQATLSRVVLLFKEDHQKVHGFESRIEEMENKITNLIRRLAEKQDKPKKDGDDGESPAAPGPVDPESTGGGSPADAAGADARDEESVSPVRD